MTNCVINVRKSEGKVFLASSGRESILFNKIVNILGVSNFDKALEIYNVTQTEDFKKYNNSLLKQYRLDKSVVKTPIPTIGGFYEVLNPEGNVRIVYKENAKSVQLELIESYETGRGLARQFLQDFIYSFPNKDIELLIAPRNTETTFQGLGNFYQSLGFEFKQGSSYEMVRYFNKGRLYPEGYDVNAEPSVKHLMNFINQQGNSKTTKKEVIQFMQSADITSSSDLLKQLSLAENEGIFIFNKKYLENTKLFSTFEINGILKSRTKQNSITELLKYLRQSTDEIIVEPLEKENTDVTSEEGKTIVVEKVSETDKNLISNDRILPKKKRGSNVKTVATIEGNFNLGLSENIAYVNRVDETDWESMQTQIETLLESIESLAQVNGINLKGLSTSFNDLNRNQVLDLLEATEAVLEGSLNVYEFDSIVNQYLGDSSETQNINIKEDEVIIESELTEEEIFNQFSLLKVGKNVFKPVKNQSLAELLNTNSIQTSRPIEEIEQEVNKNYDKSFSDIEIAKKVYLLKSNLGVLDEQKNIYTDKVDTITETVSIDFEKEFAEWLIENDNSLFTVDERGITFTDVNREFEAMESLPLYLRQDLTNYSKTSKNITVPLIEEQVIIDRGMLNYERAKVLANPNLIQEFEGLKLQIDNNIVVTNYTDNFLKSEGKIYELNDEIANVSFFTELPQQATIDISMLKPETDLQTVDYTTMESSTTETVLNNILTEQELNKLNQKHFNC